MVLKIFLTFNNSLIFELYGDLSTSNYDDVLVLYKIILSSKF